MALKTAVTIRKGFTYNQIYTYILYRCIKQIWFLYVCKCQTIIYFLSLHSLMYISVLLHHSNSKRFFKKFQTNIYSSLFTNGQKHIRTNKQTNKQTVKTLCCVHQHTHTNSCLANYSLHGEASLQHLV